MNLNKCPFCGGIAELLEEKYTFYTELFCKCMVCGAQGKIYKIKSTDDESEDNFNKMKQYAENAWNMRAKGENK